MFQRFQILDELIPPAHTESSVTFSSRSAPARSVSGKKTQVTETFQSMVSRLQELEAEVVQIQLFIRFSPLLDFSGSIGFGTWRIFVPLFWATCRLFSRFLLFWILECFCL